LAQRSGRREVPEKRGFSATVFLALLSAAAELLFEVFFQVVAEAIVALIARSIRNVLEESTAINPVLVACRRVNVTSPAYI
jgi:hypothetical protein